MDAFRSIHMNNVAFNTEPRITTANYYHTKQKPDMMAKLRGLNKLYYNMAIETSAVDEREVNMLTSLQIQNWMKSMLMLQDEETNGNFEKDHRSTVK